MVWIVKISNIRSNSMRFSLTTIRPFIFASLFVDPREDYSYPSGITSEQRSLTRNRLIPSSYLHGLLYYQAQRSAIDSKLSATIRWITSKPSLHAQLAYYPSLE